MSQQQPRHPGKSVGRGDLPQPDLGAGKPFEDCCEYIIVDQEIDPIRRRHLESPDNLGKSAKGFTHCFVYLAQVEGLTSNEVETWRENIGL